MPAATTALAPRTDRPAAGEELRCRIRLADGRVFAGPLAPERHRALQIGVLHAHTDGLVELAAGARRDGRLQITTRRRADHFLSGGRRRRGRLARAAARARGAARRRRRGGVPRAGRPVGRAG